MDKNWLTLANETRRRFSNATWVPLRASVTRRNERDVTEVGHISEVFAAGSVAIPPEHRDIGNRLGWESNGTSHSARPYAYEDGYYSPIDQRQYNDKQPIGVELIFDYPQPVVGGRKWILNPDLYVALGLIREGDTWVRPEEGFEVVIREHFDQDGDHELIEIKREFLSDYLAARGMALRLSCYWQRIENVAALERSPYEGLAEEDKERDGGRFKVLIRAINEIWGGSWAFFRTWRTDLDDGEDAPVLGPENNENVGYESSRGERTGYEGVRVEGEFWRDEWLEHAGISVRVRGDTEVSLPDFIVDTGGTRMPSQELNHEEIGRWLWFRPSVVNDFLSRRGFALEWYTNETGGLKSTSGYQTHFGLNDADLVTVYAEDVAKLPAWEQRIWAAHNVVPEGKVSKELLDAQVRTQVAPTTAPEVDFLEILGEIERVFQEIHGVDLFSHTLDLEAASARISRFHGTDDGALLRLAKELVRVFTDRLNIPNLRSLSTADNRDKLGSIKLLQGIVATHVGEEKAKSIFGPVVGIYELRVGDAHPTSSQISDSFVLAGIDRSKSHLRQARQMIEVYACALRQIADALKS